MADQRSIALNIVQQLRVLDPAVSAEVGTPERKIIDTVAEALAESQIDLNALKGAFDLDAKFGDDLDQFLANFGYGRQQGAAATGYVKFTRTTESSYVTPIPAGTAVVASLTTAINFITTEYGEIPAGDLSVVVPVRCTVIGTLGNLATGTITAFGSTPVTGITSVTNEIPTTQGADPETDAELKVRFKNTVFRNLAGTYDQYLALSVATQFTTKANVVGPISRYQEYIQVPDVDDASDDPDSGIGGNGNAGEYTSALSTIPYSQHVYTTIPYFISNGAGIFFHRDIDFVMNITDVARDAGDTYRGRITLTGPNVNGNPLTEFRPNITFKNVYTGAEDSIDAIRPQDIVLFEHSYMSNASRNDYDHNVFNCIDVYINGENPVKADTVIPQPSPFRAFVDDSTSAFYFSNFRRVGEPRHRPVVGNVLSPLYFSPLTDLPDSITTSDATYYKGTHYWLVQDVSEIGGTIRARDGIEWNPTVNGKATGDAADGPYTGPTIEDTVATAITVSGYNYDRNIVDLQTSLEANKQVTTDVLGHRSTTRYFKVDVTVMYSRGSSMTATNTGIQTALANFFDGQYFGTVIQMSDLLQVIHNVNGVDNVRWSYDLDTDRAKVVECDSLGAPLLNLLIDRQTYGTPSVTEVQQGVFAGGPTDGTFRLRYQGGTATAPLDYDASASDIYTALTAVSVPVASVTGTGTPADPFIFTFSAHGYRDLIEVVSNNLQDGLLSEFNSDFYLQDNELPAIPSGTVSGDTVAGAIIRPRAQNTWSML